MDHFLGFMSRTVFNQLRPHFFHIACFFRHRLGCRILLLLYWKLLWDVLFSVFRLNLYSRCSKQHQLFFPFSRLYSECISGFSVDVTKRYKHLFWTAHYHASVVSANHSLTFLGLRILLVLREWIMHNSNFTCKFICLKQVIIFGTQSSHVVLCWLVVQNFVLSKVTVTR